MNGDMSTRQSVILLANTPVMMMEMASMKSMSTLRKEFGLFYGLGYALIEE